MINQILEKVTEASNRIKEEQKKLAELVKNDIKDVFNEMFVLNPKLQSFSWTQYTPYFNDGDECIFRVNGYLDVEYDNVEYTELGKWNADKAISTNEVYYETTPEVAKVVYPILQLLENIDDDVFKTIFGDHVKIIVTPNGIDIEEYYHD
jgi:SepF-like predicted cell division protein (DUF552 family)